MCNFLQLLGISEDQNTHDNCRASHRLKKQLGYMSVSLKRCLAKFLLKVPRRGFLNFTVPSQSSENIGNMV